jgi:PAS domain S-box-containing protein
MSDLLRELFSADFMPHGYCYLWKPEIVWLHAVSDSIITLAYYLIPTALLYFARKRRDLPFNWMFVMFGVFIFGCGTTHLMEVWTLWHPTYALSGIVKAVTAGASIATAILLVPLVPRALVLPSPAALEQARDALEVKVRLRTRELAIANENLQAEIAERKQSEARWRAVFEKSPVGIALMAPDGRFHAVNQAYQSMLGYSEEELRELSFADIVHDQQLPWAGERQHSRKNGQVMWGKVQISVVPGQESAPQFLIAITEDVTEPRRAEEEMRKLVLLAENSPDFIGIASLEGNPQFLNPAGRALLGIAREEDIRGTKLMDYVADQDRQRVETEVWPAVFAQGRWEGEVRFKHFVTGESIPAWQRVFLITQEGSMRRLAVANISRDLRERKRAEETLQAAQTQLAHIGRVALVGELAASIAHEVNQPLAAVVTNGNACLHWLDASPANLEEARPAVARIVKEGVRAGEVIARIRSLMRKSPTETSVVDLNGLITQVISLMQREIARYEVNLRTELAPDLPSTRADPVQLQQVLVNLIMNAIEATGARPAGSHEVLVASRAVRGEISIAVQDSGLGFDPQDAELLFKPFFTTKTGGMGMGLSISRSIIEAHSGHLWASPHEGRGATFEFTLPASAH